LSEANKNFFTPTLGARPLGSSMSVFKAVAVNFISGHKRGDRTHPPSLEASHRHGIPFRGGRGYDRLPPHLSAEGKHEQLETSEPLQYRLGLESCCVVRIQVRSFARPIDRDRCRRRMRVRFFRQWRGSCPVRLLRRTVHAVLAGIDSAGASS
jgi:hypothetical protein